MVMGLLILVGPALGDPDPLPPGQLPALTAEWWEWVLSIPAPDNPLLDTTGDQCMVGQRSAICFLAGNDSAQPAVTRACLVPADATLFFPVINEINISVAQGVCGSTGTETVKELRADIKPFIDAAQNLSVTVDGRPVSKTVLRRVQSIPFDVALPADNLFAYFGLTPCPAGIYSPAVDDGYYISVGPLAPGPHTIHFQAQSDGLAIDVSYDLTVVPVLLH